MTVSMLSVASYLKPAPVFVTSAISGTMTNGSLTITIPSHQEGDLIIMYRGSQSSLPPPLPDNFTSIITSVGGNSSLGFRSMRTFYKFGDGSSELLTLSGAVGNASGAYAGAMIFRYAADIGATSSISNTSSVGGWTNTTSFNITINGITPEGRAGRTIATAFTYANTFRSAASGMTLVNAAMQYATIATTFGARTAVAGNSTVRSANTTITVQII